MSWLLRHNWLWSLLAFLLGAAITWILLDRRGPAALPEPAEAEQPAEEKVEVLVGAGITQAAPVSAPAPTPSPAPAPSATPTLSPAPTPAAEPGPTFSRLMEAGAPAEELTLFDDDTDATEPQVHADGLPGRYGEGSADAVPHQGPPDGFTIKGKAQSMLFHTPDSPYYGRTKPEVWFRTEADAERAGFTKYARRPRKSANPGEH